MSSALGGGIGGSSIFQDNFESGNLFDVTDDDSSISSRRLKLFNNGVVQPDMGGGGGSM